MIATKNKLDLKNKLKWDKSSITETNIYIKIYLNALNKLLNKDEKQVIFFISKYFTDAAAETGRDNLEIASYYFELGEEYFNVENINNNNVLKRVLQNVYHRAKSFYLYKKGYLDEAIDLIQETLNNNKQLEKMGFEFLIFDSIQQYINLSKIYISKNQSKHAFRILSDATCFLIEEKSYFLKLNDSAKISYTQDLISLRTSLLYEFITDTTTQLQKISDRDYFIAYSKLYFTPLFISLPKFKKFSEADTQLHMWIAVLKLFYEEQYDEFHINSSKFLSRTDDLYTVILKGLLLKFLKYL